jgi:small GTP-binding protein
MQDNIEVNDTESEKEPDFCFKLVMLGNSGVGKTSLIKYEIKNTFINNSDSTIVFEHSFKNYNIYDKTVRLQIWDTCGEEIYYSSLKNFYRSALCVIIVFSLDDKDSFNSLKKWIEDIKNNHNSDEYYLILIGNKKEESIRLVSNEKINEFCQNNEIENYFEANAKTGENVHDIFKYLVRKLFIKYAMPILGDNNDNKRETISNNHSSKKKQTIFVENPQNCCKTCFCYNQ